VFHDLAVGQSTACVLVSAALPASSLTLRCWGNDPLDSDLQDFTIRSEILQLPVDDQTAPKLKLSDGNVCLAGDFLQTAGQGRQGVCWGRAPDGVDDPIHVADTDAVEPTSMVPLAPPGLLVNSRVATCYTDSQDQVGGISCISDNAVALPDFLPLSLISDDTLDMGTALDMGTEMYCALNDDGELTCQGNTPPFASYFPAVMDVRSDIRVAFNAPELCIRSTHEGDRVVECLFNSNKFVVIPMSGDHYDMTTGRVCGLHSEDGGVTNQLRCYNSDAIWPGLPTLPNQRE
jgi:hypothetical protein